MRETSWKNPKNLQTKNLSAVDSAIFAEAVDMFGRQGVVELITIMGDYVMVGMVLTAIDQHLPEGRSKLLPER